MISVNTRKGYTLEFKTQAVGLRQSTMANAMTIPLILLRMGALLLTAVCVLAAAQPAVALAANLETSSNAPADVQSAFNAAVALWDFQNLDDAAGANSLLRISGPAQIGVALTGSEREASLTRGGDGMVAQLGEGCLLADQGALDELALRGRAMSLYARLRQPSGVWRPSGIVSKYGGHDRLVYNLYSTERDLGFELGTDQGLFRVAVPLADLAATEWHDIIVRYDGQSLELWVDGVRRGADANARGELRQGNTEPLVVGGYSVQGQLLGPFGGLLDTVAVWNVALSEAQIVALSGGAGAVQKKSTAEITTPGTANTPAAKFQAVIKSQDKTVYGNAALELRRWMIANDPHYPKYHFVGPESWVNDPNGPIYHDGRYHLFYQFDPIVNGRRSARCWGHAVSRDLVRWEDWPVALWPDTPQDRGGVFSGNTFVDDDGALCALYTGNVAGHRETYGILARSTDAGLTWSKSVVMDNAQRPNADSPVHWDGFVWRDGGQWQQLIGGTTGGANRQGAAWLWSSPDLKHWTLQKNIAPTIRLGAFWELPYLIPLAARHVLFVGAGNPYWVGYYDAATLEFTPQEQQPHSVDTGHFYSFNLNMIDDKGPPGARRQLMHGWVNGPPTPTKSVPYWEGLHSIPRVIRLAENRLWQEPIPELVRLRGRRFDRDESVRGDALDITATFRPGCTKQFGVKVRVSPDGREFTRVFFDAATRRFGVDGPTLARNAAAMKGVRASGTQESFLSADAPVTIRILLDRSVVEVFVNGVAYTARTFPSANALGVEVFSEGGAADMKSLEIYELNSAWGT